MKYVMFLEKTKNYNKIKMTDIETHVENIRKLDDEEALTLVGVFHKYPGMAGMFIFNAESYDKAKELCEREPLVKEGYATYKLVELEIADRSNNYLL